MKLQIFLTLLFISLCFTVMHFPDNNTTHDLDEQTYPLCVLIVVHLEFPPNSTFHD